MALLADPPVSHDRNVVTGAYTSGLSTEPDFDAGFIWSDIERGNLAVVEAPLVTYLHDCTPRIYRIRNGVLPPLEGTVWNHG
jgi:hypothetical protein